MANNTNIMTTSYMRNPKPLGIGAHAPGDITPESQGEITLPIIGKAAAIARRTEQFTGKRDWAPTHAKSWVGVVTAQLRMMNLSEIHADVKSYSGTHLAKIQDLIDSNAEGEEYLKRIQLPVICVRIPDLEIGTPGIRRVSCDALASDQKDTVALRQRKYIGLGGLNDSMSMQMPTVGSTVLIECDNDYFYANPGKYNGYFTKIITNNTARILETYEDCLPDLLKDKFDGTQEPKTQIDIEAASTKTEPEKAGWFSKNQPKGKDGQRALNRGGLVDFAKSFWDSASESYGGGEDSAGEALIGQERTQSLRSQKPSNQ